MSVRRLFFVFYLLSAGCIVYANQETLLKRADALYTAGKLKRAEYFYKKALDAGGNPSVIRFNIASIRYRLNDIGGALNWYKRVTDSAPGFRDAWINIAKIYYLYGEYALSRDVFEKWLKRRPDDREALLLLGDVYLRLRSYAAAEKCYQKVIDLAPDKSSGYAAAADLYRSLGDSDRALAVLKQSGYFISYDPSLFALEAKLLLDKGEPLQAAAVYSVIIAREATNEENSDQLPFYIDDLSDAFLKAKLTNSAIAALTDGIDRYPKNRDLIARLADLYIDTGRLGDLYDFYAGRFDIDRSGSYKGLRRLYIISEAKNDLEVLNKIDLFFKEMRNGSASKF